MQLRGSPTQSSGSDAIGNPSDELGAKGRISGGREREDEMRELSGDRLVVEGGEGGEERGEEEVRVESEKGLKEVRDREGAKELGESVGDIDDWGERVGDMVGEAPEAEGSTVMYEQRVSK